MALSIKLGLITPILLAAPVFAQQFSDGTFLDSKWTATKLVDTTPDSDALYSGIRGQGGNPGDCRTIGHNWQVIPDGVSITIGHIKSSEPHEPGAFASLQSLYLSFDARCDSAPLVNAIGFGPLLYQGAKRFTAAGTAAPVGAPWVHFETSIHPADWNQIGGTDKPDFSPGAAPIYLGFYSSNGGSGITARLTANGRVDNFLVRYIRSCPADLNGDNLVDDADFVFFVSAYNTLDCADPLMPSGCPADFNFDGLVDDSDFVVFVAGYNDLICP